MDQIVLIPLEEHRPRGVAITNLPYIWFSVPGRQGIKLMDADKPEVQNYMLGRQDSALQLVGGLEAIKLVIHWPGYREFNEEKKITIVLKDQQMTRGMLASRVACKALNFIRLVDNFQISTQGGYKSTDRTWRISPKNLNHSNVGMLGMRNTYKGYWKVDLFTTLPVRLPSVPRPLAPATGGAETSTTRQSSASGSGANTTTSIHYLPPSQ